MNEFLMIFRSVPQEVAMSPEQMQENIKLWHDWIGGIAAQGHLVGTNQLSSEGKTLHADKVTTDGPYAEVKEIIGGYVMAKAATLEDAMKLAEGCPILLVGGKVEVRGVMKMS